MLDEAGLIPFAMSGHTNLMDTERIRDFTDNIRMAHFFGCDYIVSSVGEAHIKNNAVASNEVVARHIKDLVPTLEKYDMKLVLEVHGELGDGRILGEIVSLVGSEHVMINYDTANAIFYGDVDVVEDMKGCMDKIGYMHLKEKAAGRKEWNFPALGKPLDACFERLSACPGWAKDGWLFDVNKSGLLPYDLHIHDLDVIVSVFGKPESFSVPVISGKMIWNRSRSSGIHMDMG